MSAKMASASPNKIILPSTQHEKRLQRLKGAAKADSIEYEWKLAGLLALRAYIKGLHFEIFSNVAAVRPFDDVVLRLLGPPELLPSTVTYFMQLKHTRLDAKDKTVTEQAFINPKGDFSLIKYFDWFHGFYRTPSVLSEDLKLLMETEFVQMVIFTNKDVTPNLRQTKCLSTEKLLHNHPFEKIFETSEDGVSFSFNSNFSKIWELLDKENEAKDCYQNDFLCNLTVFCKQAFSRQIDEKIEKELIEVLGKNGKKFLAPFLSFLKVWSEDDCNDFCLSNKILLDFFGKQLRETIESSVCGELKFKTESLKDLRAALRNAGPQLQVSVPEAPQPGLRAAKVLQAVSKEFGKDNWFYVDASILKGFHPQILSNVAGRAHVLITDVNESEAMTLSQNLEASIGRGVLKVALCKPTESDFRDMWYLRDLNGEALLEEAIVFQGKEVRLQDLEEIWPSMREDFGADFMASKREWSIGKPLEEYDEEILPRGLSHHHLVSARALFDEETNLNGGRLALVGFPDDLLKEAARSLGFLKSDHDAETVLKIINDNKRWTVLKPEDTPSLHFLEFLARRKAVPAIHWLEFIRGRFENDICMIWRGSFGTTEAIKSLTIPITDVCEVDQPLCCHGSEMSLKGLQRALLVGQAGMGKTTALLNFARLLKNESENQNQWVVMLKILEYKNLFMKWKDVTDVTVNHVVELVAAAASAETGGARRCLKASLTTSGAVTLLIDGVDEVAPAYKDLMIRVLKRLLELPIKRVWVATRPEVAVPLQRVLRIPALRLHPLSQQEQLEFLRNRLTSVSGEEVMQRLANTGDLLATPLHLLMTAEVFNKSTDIFNETYISLLNLYKEFIKLKKQQFEKRYTNPDNLPLHNFDKKHEICSMVFLFADDPVADQLPIQEYKMYIQNDKSLSLASEKFGIIWFEDNRLHFIHQTFPEYFAARWLFANTKTAGARKLVLQMNKSKGEESRIQVFLQDMLSEEWPLHAAAWRCDIREIQHLMQNSWGRDEWDKKDSMLQWTWGQYLQWAYAENYSIGHLTSAKDFLLRIIKKERWRSIALIAAAERGCDELVSQLLRHRSFPAKTLTRALRVAATGNEESHTRTMVLLTMRGKDDPTKKWTALHLAANVGNATSVDLLLRRYAKNVNARGSNGMTPLHFALQGHHHDAAQRILQETSVAVNEEDCDGWTPLCYASAANCVSCAETLLQQKVKINVSSVPALIAAAGNNSIKMMRFLLQKGTRVNETNTHGNTALHIAADKGHKEAVQVLLEEGADTAFRNKFGQFALDNALQRNNVEIIEVLLENMVSTTFSKEKSDNTILKALVLKGAAWIGFKEEVLKILQSATLSPDDLSAALRVAAKGQSEDHTAITQILLNHGAKDTIDRQLFKEQRSALHWAAIGGNAATVALLLKHSPIDLNARDSIGRTALDLAIGFKAAAHKHEAAQIILQEESVEVNAKDSYTWTPLFYASAANCVSCAEILLKRGAKVDGYSDPPLTAAAENNSIDVLRYLLQNGACVNAKNTEGITALNCALNKGHKEAAQVLLQEGAGHSPQGRMRKSHFELRS